MTSLQKETGDIEKAGQRSKRDLKDRAVAYDDPSAAYLTYRCIETFCLQHSIILHVVADKDHRCRIVDHPDHKSRVSYARLKARIANLPCVIEMWAHQACSELKAFTLATQNFEYVSCFYDHTEICKNLQEDYAFHNVDKDFQRSSL